MKLMQQARRGACKEFYGMVQITLLFAFRTTLGKFEQVNVS